MVKRTTLKERTVAFYEVVMSKEGAQRRVS